MAMGCPRSLHWFVRELIPTRAAFTAFEGMPVTRELRIFVKDGKIEHTQPYWPPESIRDPSVSDWAPLLEEVNTIPLVDMEYLQDITLSDVAPAFKGYWPDDYFSVDWLQDIDGRWWCIDMAPGARSYKWNSTTPVR